MVDWLICAATCAEVIRDTQIVLSHATSLGLRVKLEKSNLVPAQVTTFWWMVLDSWTRTACPSPRRVCDIVGLLPQFRRRLAPPYVRYAPSGDAGDGVSCSSPGFSVSSTSSDVAGYGLDPEQPDHRHRRLPVSSQCFEVPVPMETEGVHHVQRSPYAERWFTQMLSLWVGERHGKDRWYKARGPLLCAAAT